ncbi:hypothetical protein ACFTZC_41950, partial [Streptomyces sp. NPDC056987]
SPRWSSNSSTTGQLNSHSQHEPLCPHSGGHLSNQQLTARISELTNANRQLEQEIAQLQPLKERVDELEKDLAAARSSLRKMIRAENA